MAIYLRFQTSVRDHDTHRPLGVFRAAGTIEDSGELDEYFRDALRETLAWFNEHLSVPRIAAKDGNCVFWFCADHQAFVHRLWDIVAILKAHDVLVRKVRTTDPGMIVYRDDYQIAAIPSRIMKHALQV